MLVTKLNKVDEDCDGHNNDDVVQTSEEDNTDGQFSDAQSSMEEQSPDTDEITGTKLAKSKKTLKRKRRATDPSHFSATLNALLNTDAPSSLPLSLQPSVARKRTDEKSEQKARQILQIKRKEKEDKRRIQDVIGGWGGEGERYLRKVAQRGGK
jgi:Rrp15p